MIVTKHELAIVLVNVAYVAVFTVSATRQANHEFLLYAGVILLIAGWLVLIQRQTKFSLAILWGLTAWGLMHMAGGNVRFEDEVLYSRILLPIIPAYDILRYDQIVHTFGFAVATLICHHLLGPYLRPDYQRTKTLLALVLLMGSGVGAVNEIVEFIATVLLPETNVGGYTNTALDLCCNFLGGLLAVTYLRLTSTREAQRISAPITT